MRIRQLDMEEDAPVNLMPLIDMVFLLLIFFLVATTFTQEERDTTVQLPGTFAPHPLSAPPSQLIINITTDGTAKIGGRTYSYKELAQVLAGVARNQPNREVLIRADDRSLHKYFAEVADLCRRVGINELRIGYVLRSSNYGPRF